MVTRNITITDPVGIHARPAAQFAQAVAASGWMATFGVMQSVVRPTRSAELSQFPSNGSI